MRDDRVRDEIRSRVDIVDVVSAYLTLKKSGANHYKGLCPFHEEKTPSFSVNQRLQFYYCFGCHASGDAFKFLMEMERLTFPEAMRRLAERAGIRYEPRKMSPEAISERDRQYDLHREAARFFHENLQKSPDARDARQYLEKRGLGEEWIGKFQLGYAPDSWDATLSTLLRRGFKLAEVARSGLAIEREGGVGAYDRFRNRLMFPIQDAQGKVIAFGGRTLSNEDAKYINSPETLLFTKGQTLYGLHLATARIRERDQVVLVEGYMDLIALHQHGFEHSLATLGTAITPANLQTLRRFTKNVAVAFDGDSAGMNAVLRSAPLFEQQEVDLRVIALPEADDPDTFLRTHGGDAFEQAMAQAMPLIDFRIARVAARHTMQDDASCMARIQETLPILLEIRRPILLEQQVSRLAQQWTGGDPRRAQSLEAAIKQEIAIQRRKARTVEAREGPAPSTGLSPIPPLPRVVRAERQLLGLALADLTLARRVLEEVGPDRFVDDADREIAQHLYEFVCSCEDDKMEGREAQQFMEQFKGSVLDVAAQLFMENEEARQNARPPARPDERSRSRFIADLLAVIHKHHAQRQLVALSNELREKIESGDFSSSSETLKTLAQEHKVAAQAKHAIPGDRLQG